MNRVELIGGLVKDPESQQLESGFSFTRFVLAVNGARFSSKEGRQVVTSDYIGCNAWGETGARAMKELQKGDEIYVLGKLDQRQNVLADGSKDAHTRVAIFTYTIVRRSRREM